VDSSGTDRSEAALIDELVTLRKGRGLNETRIRDRIGPVLHTVCKLDGASHGETRQQLIRVFREAAEQLPSDLARAYNAMFGLSAEYQLATLTERQSVLANQLGCDLRTVRRRCDDALQLAAEKLIVSDGPPSYKPGRTPVLITHSSEEANILQGSWYLRRFTALVRVDLPRPEIREERCIVAGVDDLTSVTASTGILSIRPESAELRRRNEITNPKS
jgi:hypothetical protein